MRVYTVLSNEGLIRIACLLAIALWIVALAAYLVVTYAGVEAGSHEAMPAWRTVFFAPASILYMIVGLIMVVWHLLFVTLAISVYCLVVSAAKAARGQWHWLTVGLATLAVAGHSVFLLYP